MKVARLNNSGINEFEAYLAAVREGRNGQAPLQLLESSTYTEEFDWQVELGSETFKTRFEWGRFLVEKLSHADQARIMHDRGFWSWMGLFYFDQVCPANQDGIKSVLDDSNYVLSVSPRKYSRHAARTTYMLVRDYEDTVKYLLGNPMHKRGEFTEQLAARPKLISARGIMEAAHRLYADDDRGIWKRGAASKGKGGTVRRFGVVLNQFELTYDIYSMLGDEILGILPAEFNGFRAAV